MNTLLLLLSLAFMFSVAQSFKSVPKFRTFAAPLSMIKITNNVEFDTIAREWRMKWTPDNDKKSLESIQQTLVLFTNAIKKVSGVKSVQRVVCGGCLDYKVIVALEADKFANWEAQNFAPEADFLAAVKAVPGVSQVETQTYTIMPVV